MTEQTATLFQEIESAVMCWVPSLKGQLQAKERALDKLETLRQIVEPKPDAPPAGMRFFYVSLIEDACGVYLRYTANSEAAVRAYLERRYYKEGTWTMRWCAVYADTLPKTPGHAQTVVEAQCGYLYQQDLDALNAVQAGNWYGAQSDMRSEPPTEVVEDEGDDSDDPTSVEYQGHRKDIEAVERAIRKS